MSETGKETGLELAVIGMDGRFPGARNLYEFRDNLENGIDTITFFSGDELEEAGIDPLLLEDSNYVKALGKIPGIEYFDAVFFGYTPKEAEIMDPQVRIFHECVWTALEDAGYGQGNYNGLIGLYAGSTASLGWQARCLLSGKSFEMGLFAARQLSQNDYLSTRISYKFNLMGPSFVLNTACSTSLTAIHVASQALLNGECDMALAGGVTAVALEKTGYLYQEGMISSPDGHCRAFDAGSGGIVAGDGAGVVLIKRLEDAISDRDHLYAVVKGSALNNDGIRKAGYSAASVEGQAEVIKMALQMAGVEPGSISYIEAHGTGTALGDPVEIEALKIAFETNQKGYCGIGSVKSNVGHLDAAAGVVGFIKTVLALKYKLIPPTLHFEIPNPGTDLINSPFYINSSLAPWENKQEGYPLRAGVSSFGIGGTNVHVILEEAPPYGIDHSAAAVGENRKEGEYRLLLLSAKTEPVLRQMMQNLAGYLKRNPGINLADVAYTLQVGRKSFEYRWMTVVSTGIEAITALESPGGKLPKIPPHAETLPIEKAGPAADKPALSRIGQQWLQGHHIDWQDFYTREERYRISLPTYPFERRRYWIETEELKNPTRRLPQNILETKNRDLSAWFYLPAWKKTILSPQEKRILTNRHQWLVFDHRLSLGLRLVNRLKEMQQDVVVVKAGDRFASGENDNHKTYAYTIDPRRPDHYENLFNRLKTEALMPDKILHLWNVTGTGEGNITGKGEGNVTGAGEGIPGREIFDEAQYLGFYSMLYLTKALGKHNFSRDINIYVLSDQVQEVIGGEPLSPGKSTVLGLLKSIPQEYPGIRCGSIDILLPEPGGARETELIDALVEEFAVQSNEPAVAYRNNQRWVQTFDQLNLEKPGTGQLGLTKPGVYLVTGGLGTIGLIFSGLLAKHAGASLVLTGRSGFPLREEWDQWLKDHDETDPTARKIEKLLKIEAMGGKVLYFQADAADSKQMQEIIQQAEKRLGKINGVIHAAGVTEGQSMRSIQELTDSDCRLQFHAKVYGTMVLAELFKNKNPDFCWMLSSISCVLGGLGFGAYASANVFMDTFVKRYNRDNGSKWFSLNWDGIEAEKSLDAFERILSLRKVDQLVFSRGGNLQDRIDRWIKLETLRESAMSPAQRPSNLYPRPELSTAYMAPRTPAEEIIAGIFQNLLGYGAIGRQDDFLELGGDSLKAITVISRIHQELKVNIPVSEFFTSPTVEGLANYISAGSPRDTFVSIEPAEKKEYYVLSPAQKRLYIIHRLDENNLSYNISKVVVLEGALQCQEIDGTFGMLVRRHESLRTSFAVLETEPIQQVHERVEFCIEYNNLSADEEKYKSPGRFLGATGENPGKEGDRDRSFPKSPEQRAANYVKAFIRPFDLTRAPLLRVGLIKIHGEKHILMLDMHHIISDGVSLDILVKDYMQLFSNTGLTPLKIHYKDFSEWLTREQQQEEKKKQEGYWFKMFKTPVPALHLPMDYERPAEQGGEGDTVPFEIDEKKTGQIKKLAADQDVTLFMVLTAVYTIFLSRLTGREDITVGTGTAGRRHAGLMQIIGMFVNTLALRNFPAKEKSFTTFLKEVKENTLQAFENQDYPFEELVRKILPGRNRNRNPLFDTVIVSNNMVVEAGDLPGVESSKLQVKPYPLQRKFSSFDMGLLYYETGNELQLAFEYSTKLFKKETMEKYVAYFKEIVSTVVENHDLKLEDIAISHRFLRASAKKPAVELNI